MFGNRQRSDQDEVPEVAVAARRGISIVWLIPLVAGAIAIWLAYTTLSEKGPTITITFATAEGLEAGKTKVKYKDVEVGLVEDVALSDDLSHIVVTASMDKSIEHHVNEGTQFWIVRPRIGVGGVSGLEHPALRRLCRDATRRRRAEQELHRPRGAAADRRGRAGHPIPAAAPTAWDRSARGSPIYYRDVEVGQVLELRPRRRPARPGIYRSSSSAPPTGWCGADSRFWSASGVDVSVGANGVNVRMQSLQALLAGGIAFDTPSIARPGEQAVAGADFPLFDSLASVGDGAVSPRSSPTCGLLRRLGARPEPGRAGRVPRHPGRQGHRRQAGDLDPATDIDPHSGDPRYRAGA